MSKKIMFNDRYGLTQAVIDGRKTQTRRIILQKHIVDYNEWREGIDALSMPQCVPYTIQTLQECLLCRSKYDVGDVVAVAQSYKDAEYDSFASIATTNPIEPFIPIDSVPGWTNKMFVRADMMPHRIRITAIRIERLQDISDEDCIKEGVKACGDSFFIRDADLARNYVYSTPKLVYATLIDKISGKGTWTAIRGCGYMNLN